MPIESMDLFLHINLPGYNDVRMGLALFFSGLISSVDPDKHDTETSVLDGSSLCFGIAGFAYFFRNQELRSVVILP
jgi:hypothetical protein